MLHPSYPFAITVALTVLACIPDTELRNERPSGDAASNGPGNGGGAATSGGIELLDPPSGARVPRNLARLLVAFPRALNAEDSEGAPGLRVTAGVDVHSITGAPFRCAAERACYAFPLDRPLPAGVTGIVETAAAMIYDDGTAVPELAFATLEVGSAVDEQAPQLLDVRTEAGGSCVRVQGRTDEPATVTLGLSADGTERFWFAGDGLGGFDVPIFLGRAMAAEILVRAVDWAGQATASAPVWAGAAPLGLPPFVITEVLANPAGSELTQEMVELKNVDAAPASLAGLRIEDATGGDELPAEIVPAQGFVVIVSGSFDSLDPRDMAPAPEALVVRVEGRIGRDGLSNAGEPVRIRATTGQIVSSYGGWLDMSATAWSGKSAHRLSEDACDHPTGWSRDARPATPGR